jgi:hypothetical protein
MQDPKIKKLVTTFESDLMKLNKSWNSLQTHGVYVRMEIKGNHTYNDPKWLEANQITQEVSYKKSITTKK